MAIIFCIISPFLPCRGWKDLLVLRAIRQTLYPSSISTPPVVQLSRHFKGCLSPYLHSPPVFVPPIRKLKAASRSYRTRTGYKLWSNPPRYSTHLSTRFHSGFGRWSFGVFWWWCIFRCPISPGRRGSGLSTGWHLGTSSFGLLASALLLPSLVGDENETTTNIFRPFTTKAHLQPFYGEIVSTEYSQSAGTRHSLWCFAITRHLTSLVASRSITVTNFCVSLFSGVKRLRMYLISHPPVPPLRRSTLEVSSRFPSMGLRSCHHRRHELCCVASHQGDP